MAPFNLAIDSKLHGWDVPKPASCGAGILLRKRSGREAAIVRLPVLSC